MSRTRSIPLSSSRSTRLTEGTGSSHSRSACQTKASALARSFVGAAEGARRSSAAAMRVRRGSRLGSFMAARKLGGGRLCRQLLWLLFVAASITYAATRKEIRMFSSPAWAQMPFGGGGGGGEALMQILPLVLIFVVFYFLLIRPQQKKSKEHKDMLGKLRRGDRVVTGGGIVGTVAKVPDSGDEISVDIAENV